MSIIALRRSAFADFCFLALSGGSEVTLYLYPESAERASISAWTERLTFAGED
jgi:hypothetical protein